MTGGSCRSVRRRHMTEDDAQPCRPPLRSTGSRSFPARSKSSARGFLLAKLPAEDQWRQIIYESNLERQTALLTLARNDVLNLWDQPERVAYVDHRGLKVHHVFDYLLQFRNGRRLAIAVKPDKDVERLGFRQTLERIRSSLPLAFAHDIALVTDRSLHPAETQNAELLHMFRKMRDDVADQVIADAILLRPGGCSVADLCAATKLGARAFPAIVRAIYTGAVRADVRERISGTTHLYCPEHKR